MPFPNKETQFRSGDEAVENGKKGGIASGESRRAKKLLADYINDEFEELITVNGKELTKKQLAALRLVRMINNPNTPERDFLKALEMARDTIGEKPIEKVAISEVDADIVAEVENIVLNDTETSD